MTINRRNFIRGTIACIAGAVISSRAATEEIEVELVPIDSPTDDEVGIKIREIMERHANDLVFGPNDEHTRRAWATGVSDDIETLVKKRQLFHFNVICDEVNNPASVIEGNQFRGEVWFQKTHVAAFYNYKLKINFST